jgi:chromate reductase, NAD(P)H dehydrogenase (quinone)
MKVLAISGSLRAASTNTALLRALPLLAPPHVEIILCDLLSSLPHFNSDLDIEPAPPAVQEFRNQLVASDFAVISTPEYAHGLPGSLKNALDWLVRSGELYGKPMALLNASPRSTFAQASLIETLTVMGAQLAKETFLTVPLLGQTPSPEQIAGHPEQAAALRQFLLKIASSLE